MHPEKFEIAKNEINIYSKTRGYIKKIDALSIGEASMHLGAGREKIDDKIDMSAGIVLNKKIGDSIFENELLCTLFTNKDDVKEIIDDVYNAFTIVPEKVNVDKKLTHNIIE